MFARQPDGSEALTVALRDYGIAEKPLALLPFTASFEPLGQTPESRSTPPQQHPSAASGARYYLQASNSNRNCDANQHADGQCCSWTQR